MQSIYVPICPPFPPGIYLSDEIYREEMSARSSFEGVLLFPSPAVLRRYTHLVACRGQYGPATRFLNPTKRHPAFEFLFCVTIQFKGLERIALFRPPYRAANGKPLYARGSVMIW